MKRENPLLNPVPDDMLERVHMLALDLAYSVAEGLIQPYVFAMRDGFQLVLAGRPNDDPHNARIEALENEFWGKWENKLPSHHVLVALKYLAQTDGEALDLTEKAFLLLDKPANPPSVFISYKRGESSAFALLIEARLRLAGNPNPYLDKSLVAGEEWAKALEEHVRGAKYFVLLVHADTAKSQYIRDEIDWARDAGCRIISICYPGVNIETCGIDGLAQYHVIDVKGQAASDYEDSVDKLLNALGYATY
jgi:hypothetical protein